jgi:dCMP deaminase
VLTETSSSTWEYARPDWDMYFTNIAYTVSTRGECRRARVGAIIVRDHRIVATGYNGAAAGRPSCLEGHCPRAESGAEPGSSYDTGPGACIAIHAEANALLYADYARCVGATLYTTREPCDGCRKLIAGVGITRVVYPS